MVGNLKYYFRIHRKLTKCVEYSFNEEEFCKHACAGVFIGN